MTVLLEYLHEFGINLHFSFTKTMRHYNLPSRQHIHIAFLLEKSENFSNKSNQRILKNKQQIVT